MSITRNKWTQLAGLIFSFLILIYVVWWDGYRHATLKHLDRVIEIKEQQAETLGYCRGVTEGISRNRDRGR